MKKLSIIIVTICALCTQSFGQTDSEVRMGLKGGFNLSNVYDEEGEHFVADNKFGLTGGAFLNIPLSKVVGFQPEFMFAQKGFSATGNYGLLGGRYSFTRTTYFFEVPLLLQIKANDYFSLVGGPQYCYLFKTRDVYSREDGTITSVEEQEISNDNFRKNILALDLGFDIDLDNVILSGRAGWDLQKNNGDGSSSAPRYKNHWFQLTVGYLF